MKPELQKKIIIIIPYLRIALGVFSLSLVFYLAVNSIKSVEVEKSIQSLDKIKVLGAKADIDIDTNVIINSPNSIAFELARPSSAEIEEAWVIYQEKMKKLEEERRRQEEERLKIRNQRIEALANYLKNMGSPMYIYAELILDSCEKYSVEYCKIFLSISGVETGFGRVAYYYSAWGMIGVKYPSWEVAIPRSADWIANNYFLRGIDTFEELAFSPYHGGDEVARNQWIKDLYSFYHTIPL